MTQAEIDVSNLRFYAQMFNEYKWETDVLHWSVFRGTLEEIASRYENLVRQAAQASEGEKA